METAAPSNYLWYAVPMLLAEVTRVSISTLVATAVVGLVYVFYHQKVQWKSVNQIPGPRDWFWAPFSGLISLGVNAFGRLSSGTRLDILAQEFLVATAEKNREHGIFRLFRLFTPFVFIFRADHVEQVLTHSVNIKKGVLYETFTPWLNRGLLTSDGSKWKARRRQLNPVFHFRSLEDYGTLMNEHSRRFNKFLLDRPADKMDITPYVNQLSLDLICATIMGVPMDVLYGGDGSEYLNSVIRFSEIVITRAIFPHQWNMNTFKHSSTGREHDELLRRLHSFTKEIIAKRKVKIAEIMAANGGKMPENPAKYRPLLDILLEQHVNDPDSMTLENIQEEVDTFTFSGHDTTALGLMFSIYLIGLHPEVQEKLQEEIAYVFSEDIDADVTTDKVKDLKYLDAVIKECHRIYPPVSLIGRELVEDMQMGDYTVPKGSNVYIHIYSLHRDPKVFPDPERFDPDRFLPENTVGRNAYAYTPFSAGPRSCIGQRYATMQEKIVLTTLLRKNNLVTLMPRDKLDLIQDIVLHSKNGLPVKVVPRTDIKA